MTIPATWNQKTKIITVVVVKEIKPEFIGGIDTMKEFGVKLVKINNIETSLINKIYTDKERINKALVVNNLNKK